VCGDDLDSWWDLKLNIYALIIALCFILARINTRGWLRFILSLGVGFCVSNIIDRVFFDISSYTLSDILMVVVTIISSFFNWKK